jgi:hypothetical protein
MNIFKILASGDGSINEPNVSAFLGYLLNPKADHGINDQLLKKVMYALYSANLESSLRGFLVDKYGACRNLSPNSNFEIEVLLEQAFTDSETERKQIVDVVILCYEKPLKKKESLARITLSNQSKGELKQIFLIENKIREGAVREEQLFDQYTATVKALNNVLGKNEEELSQLLSIIFISPYGEKAVAEFERVQKRLTIPSMHIYWSVDDDVEKSSPTMTEFLKAILIQEAHGDIDAIDEYTKSTLKSFIQFIDNGFKSYIEEELESQTVRDIGYDFHGYREKYQGILSKNSWTIAEQFQAVVKSMYDDVIVRYTRTHPVSILVKDRSAVTKIFSLTRTGRSLYVNLVYRKGNSVTRQIMESLATDFGKEHVKTVVKDDHIQIRDKNIDANVALEYFNRQYFLIKKGFSAVNIQHPKDAEGTNSITMLQ